MSTNVKHLRLKREAIRRLNPSHAPVDHLASPELRGIQGGSTPLSPLVVKSFILSVAGAGAVIAAIELWDGPDPNPLPPPPPPNTQQKEACQRYRKKYVTT